MDSRKVSSHKEVDVDDQEEHAEVLIHLEFRLGYIW
jgi:hypothetical protein